MLGNFLAALTDAGSAEAALGAIGDPGVLERVRQGAAAEGIGVGAFVASTVRQVLDHAEEDVWLDLLGRMSGSQRPGVAALEAILARAFPESVAASDKDRVSKGRLLFGGSTAQPWPSNSPHRDP